MHQTFRANIVTAFLVFVAPLISLVPTAAVAKPANNTISAIPNITSISVANGQLVAAGTVTATIKGTTTTVPFSGVPVDITVVPGQIAGACPVLDLSLGPINLNLLGLVVTTSPICLEITAFENGGLLGQLLCAVGNLLNGGLSLADILQGSGIGLLPGLTPGEIGTLLSGLTNLLNTALSNLANAVVTGIDVVDARRTCAILHLELGPLNLTLLGLNVVLDNCANGPVTVDLTARTGRGNLLGNLLCDLLGDGLGLGATLQGILNQILALLGG